MSDIASLYLHIPFCERKCEYCDFTSVAGLHGDAEYMTALQREVRTLGALFPGVTLETVFVGGGTPSLVVPESLAALLDAVADSFRIDANAEITLEANPSSITRDRAHVWRRAGFNRVSIGVQSLEPHVLRFLGRVHDGERPLAAIAEVQGAGFENVNCDLIYAVPGLDESMWAATLRRLVASGPTHVSCYELTVEQGTPLHRSVRLGHVVPVAGEHALRQHRMAVDELAAKGLEQYEVSNFSLRGSECRHNLAYWRNRHYLAAGVGAHGHVAADQATRLGAGPAGGAAVRYWHGRGIASFTRSAMAGRVPIAGWEAVSSEIAEMERVMLGLRLREGVAVSGAAASEAYRLAAAGLLHVDGGRARVTERGEDVLNAVALRLVSPAIAA